MTYQLVLALFKTIKYDPKIDLETFSKKFILSCPFVSFADIYDPTTDKNKAIQKVLSEVYERSLRTGNKSLLLYGPRGSGKTLAVHALANQTGAILAQVEGLNNFKVKYFVKEFARITSEVVSKRPIFIFLRNIETLVNNALPELLFLFDKFSNFKKNILFICSSSVPLNALPKQLKFYYVQCINCANQNTKYGLFKFLTNKFGITVDMPEQDLMNFVYQNLRNYSNYDVFLVIKMGLDLRKQNGGNLGEFDRNILEKAIKAVPGSLSPQVIQAYYL
jgi:SpoVK/Ycf46/Vps4 family AAA+-type ATPase